jgi:antitoxin component of RelBE/YafQ-DinJ toxin-antitoxin module
MNKHNISSIYIPQEDHQTWNEAEILAKLLGMTRSKLVCILLRKALTNVNTPTEVSVTDIAQHIPERSRQILYELSNKLKAT